MGDTCPLCRRAHALEGVSREHRARGARPAWPGEASSTPRRQTAAATELSRPTEPNALWCADYNGEFMLGNRRYCYPLTITDFASRFLLMCDALSTTHRNDSPSPSSSARSKNLGCRRRSERTTACRLPPRMRSTGSANCRSGGYGWGSRSSASSQGIRNKTGGMSGCT